MKTLAAVLLLTASTLAFPAVARATDYMPATLKERVAKADLIVVGTMGPIQDVRTVSTKRGKLSVTRVIRANAPVGREIVIGWMGEAVVIENGRVVAALPGGIHCRTGETGIWLLKKNRRDGLYHIFHPVDKVRGMKKLAEVRGLAKDSTRKGTDFIAQGLQLTLSSKESFIPGEPIEITARLTNVAKKAITITDADFPAYHFRIQATDPDGKAVPMKMFKLAPEKPIPLVLPPGGSYSRTLDLEGFASPLTKVGRYRATVRYTAGGKKGWSGALHGRPVQFALKLPAASLPDKVRAKATLRFVAANRKDKATDKLTRPARPSVIVTLTNDSKVSFAWTLESAFLTNGKDVYGLQVKQTLPNLFPAGKTSAFLVSDWGAARRLKRQTPWRCGLVVRDFAGHRYVLGSKSVEAKPEGPPLPD